MSNIPSGENAPTIREVYQLIETVERRLAVKIDTVMTDVNTRFSTHELQHINETDKRNSLLRWAVTSILTGTGVLFGIFVKLHS